MSEEVSDLDIKPYEADVVAHLPTQAASSNIHYGHTFRDVNEVTVVNTGTSNLGCTFNQTVVLMVQPTNGEGPVQCISAPELTSAFLQLGQGDSRKQTPNWKGFETFISNAKISIGYPEKMTLDRSSLCNMNITSEEIVEKSANVDDKILKLLYLWAALYLCQTEENQDLRSKTYINVFKGITETIEEIVKTGKDLRIFCREFVIKEFDASVDTFVNKYFEAIESGWECAFWFNYCLAVCYKICGETEKVISVCQKMPKDVVIKKYQHLKIIGKLYHILGLAYWKVGKRDLEKTHFETALKYYHQAKDWKEDESDRTDCMMRIRNNLTAIEVRSLVTNENIPTSRPELTALKSTFDSVINNQHSNDTKLSCDLKVSAIKICLRRIRETVESYSNKNEEFNTFVYQEVIPYMNEMSQEIPKQQNANFDHRVETLVACCFNIGLTYSACERYNECIEALNKGRDKLEEHFEAKSKCHQIYGHCLNNIGVAYKEMGDLDECLKWYKESAVVYDQVDNWRDHFEMNSSKQLTQRNITSIEIDIKMKAYNNFVGNTDFNTIIEDMRRLYAENDDPNYKVWTAQLVIRKLKEAIEDLCKSDDPMMKTFVPPRIIGFMKEQTNVIEQEQEATDEVKWEMLAWCYFSIGLSYDAMLQYDEMIKSNNTALERISNLGSVGKTYLVYLHCLNNIGYANEQLNNYEKAIENYQEAKEIHPKIQNWNNIREKERLLQLINDNLIKCKVSNALNPKMKKDNLWFKNLYRNIITDIPTSATDEEKARHAYERCCTVCELICGISLDGDEAVQTALDYMVPKMKEIKDSIHSLDFDSSTKAEYLAQCSFNIGQALDKLEDFEKMKENHVEAIELFEQETSNYKEHELYAWCVNNLAWAYEITHKLDEAKKKYERAKQLMEMDVKWAGEGFKQKAITTPEQSLRILIGKKSSLDAREDKRYEEAVLKLKETAQQWKDIDDPITGFCTITEDVKAIVVDMKKNLPYEMFVSEVEKYPTTCIKEMISGIRKSHSQENVKTISEIKALVHLFAVYDMIRDYDSLLEISQHGIAIMRNQYSDDVVKYHLYGECVFHAGVAYKHLNQKQNAKEKFKVLRDFYGKCFWRSEDEKEEYMNILNREVESIDGEFQQTSSTISKNITSPEISDMLTAEEIIKKDVEVDDMESCVDILTAIKDVSYKVAFGEDTVEDDVTLNFALTSAASILDMPTNLTPVSDVISIDPSGDEDKIYFQTSPEFTTMNFCTENIRLLKYEPSETTWNEIERIKETGSYVQVVNDSDYMKAKFNISCMLVMNNKYEFCCGFFSKMPTVYSVVKKYFDKNGFTKTLFDNVIIKVIGVDTLEYDVSLLTPCGHFQFAESKDFKIFDICKKPGCILKRFKFVPSETIGSSTSIKVQFQTNKSNSKKFKFNWCSA